MEIHFDRERRQCISVPIVNNIVPDNLRQFILAVTSTSHSVSVIPAVVTIVDDGKNDVYILQLLCGHSLHRN